MNYKIKLLLSMAGMMFDARNISAFVGMMSQLLQVKI